MCTAAKPQDKTYRLLKPICIDVTNKLSYSFDLDVVWQHC